MCKLFQDIRYSFRMMMKNPGFTGVAVLTLAVGIGANTVIFCVAKGLMYPPLPYRDAGGILSLFEAHPVRGGFGTSIPDYFDWKEQNHVFQQLFCVSAPVHHRFWNSRFDLRPGRDYSAAVRMHSGFPARQAWAE